MKIRKTQVGLLVALGVMVAIGSLAPETFTADATVNRDRSYAFSYRGPMVYRPYHLDREGAAEDSDDAKAARDGTMAEIAKTLVAEKDGAFRKVEYVGNGVFDVEYAGAGVLGETCFFPSHEARIIRFDPQDDGTIVIQGEIGKKDWVTLKKAGVELSGEFSVKTDAEVVGHNASKTPGLFSSVYGWKIGLNDPAPHMILKSSD